MAHGRSASFGATVALTRCVRAPVNGVKDIINCHDLSCQQIIGRVGQRAESMDTSAILKANGVENLRLESRVTPAQR